MIQKITPFFWFDTQAEEAAKFYVSVFPNSKIIVTTHYDEAGAKASGMKAGGVMTVGFELNGQKFTAINGGKPKGWNTEFTGAISFVINCEDQAEVDHYWEALGEGGQTGVCGWIYRDKFGITWQVVPTILPKLLSDPDKEKAGRAMKAMLQMTKIDIAGLEKAAK